MRRAMPSSMRDVARGFCCAISSNAPCKRPEHCCVKLHSAACTFLLRHQLKCALQATQPASESSCTWRHAPLQAHVHGGACGQGKP